MGSTYNPKFTDAQYQAAAAQYIASGSYPSWWGSAIQGANTGSTFAAVTAAQRRVRDQQQAQQAAQIAFMTGGAAPPPMAPPPPSAAPQSSTPTVDQVSSYLTNLLAAPAAAAGSVKLTYQQLAAQAAAAAQAKWLTGGRGSANTGSGAPAPPTIDYASSGSSSSGQSTSWMFQGQGSGVNTPITQDKAKGIQTSTDIDSITYSASINDEMKASGPITTLLDLVNRDQQENDLFPMRTEMTWFARDTERRVTPFTPVLQEIALRGPGSFAQRFSFDLGSIVVGDLLLGTALQLQLDHWMDAQSRNMYMAGKLSYGPGERPTAWEYANSLGTSIIEQAELEIDGKTLETIDGDFIHVFSSLFPDYNTQVGLAYDHIGEVSIRRLTDANRSPTIYPVENGNLNCILPFFFMRTRLKEALPMIAIREGYVKIHITLRPFSDCVRQMRGFRESCTSVPPPTPIKLRPSGSVWQYDAVRQVGSWDFPPQFSFTITLGSVVYNWNFTASTQLGGWVTPPPETSFSVAASYRWTASTSTWSPSNPPFNINYQDGLSWYYWENLPQAWKSGAPYLGAPPFNITYGNTEWDSKVGDWSVAAPPFKSVQLLAYGAIVDGNLRNKMLRNPFEILHRQVQTFSFDEPMKYAVGKRADSDTIRIQLPLEANHPIEEILWFVRRKGTSINNEWTNYSSILETEWATKKPTPLLQNAILQVNGTVVCDAEEQFYREHAAYAHRGGYAAFSRFIYGYSFAANPGEHQPSGSLNASRVNSLRLVLDVKPPGGDLWEVKVFCIAMNWLRFQNGLANPMFED